MEERKMRTTVKPITATATAYQDAFPWYTVRYLDDGSMRVVSMHTSESHAMAKLAKCTARDPGRRFAVLAARTYRAERRARKLREMI
jgi:hypothetical protein